MGRFAPKYSSEQRQAIIRAMQEDRLTGPEIVRKAAAGELGELAPFSIPVQTVYDIARRERKRRDDAAVARVRDTTQGQLEHGRRVVIQIVEAELDRVEQAAGDGPITQQELSRLLKLTRILATASRSGPGAPPVQDDEEETAGEESESPFMDRLRARAEVTSGNGSEPDE